MGRILALTYFFPPIGGAGPQRPLRLIKHLGAHGHEPVVLTSPGRAEDRWTPDDEALLAEIPTGLQIARVASTEPSSGGIRGQLERWAGVPQPWTRWWRSEAVRLGAELGPSCDLVWAVMQPYESARAAATLSARLGVPWVADLADPWALDEMLIYPTSVHRRLAMHEMRETLSSAAGIVMNTPEAAARLAAAFPELATRPIAIVPVGWERSDFVGPAPESGRNRRFRIAHTGYLHTELGLRQQGMARLRRHLGGARDHVQILTRSHLFLVQALEELFREQPDLRGRVELVLAGVQNQTDRDAVASTPWVEMRGYLSHTDSVALLRSADLLFLPMHDLPPGVRAGIVPGKTYEYLASGRPILGAVPDGDARDILAEAGNAFLCRPDDVGAMRSIVARRVASFFSGEEEPRQDQAVVARYEYTRLASELAAFFDEVLAAASVQSRA